MLSEMTQAGRTVYIVDDGADYRFLVEQAFTRFLPQYDVRLFSGGDALLRHLRAGSARPALILLDLQMPDLNGPQTLKALKQEPAWRSIPVVVVTSSVSAGEIWACYDAGANSCLAKPLDFDSLRQRLEQVCAYWVDTNYPIPVWLIDQADGSRG